MDGESNWGQNGTKENSIKGFSVPPTSLLIAQTKISIYKQGSYDNSFATSNSHNITQKLKFDQTWEI